MVRRLALVIEYNGARYHGFQLQNNTCTVQGELENALYKFTRRKIRIAGASRTDTGVHALGQVITFVTDQEYSLKAWVNALNYYLPADIAVRSAYEVDIEFDARRCAFSREYRYNILNIGGRSPLRDKLAYLVHQPLDVAVMNRCCQFLIGEHDFISFVSLPEEERNTIRRVDVAEVRKKDDYVIFRIIGSSFLPYQLRNTVGSLIRVGSGDLTEKDFSERAFSGERGVMGPAVPGKGLYLMRVNYPPQWGPIGEGL